MDKLESLLEKFSNDALWNTENKDGTHRFDKKIEWIRSMFLNYSKALSIPVDELVEVTEKSRDCSWPNYYQKSNFPELDAESVIGVFKTPEEFQAYAKAHWVGFRCPKCGTVGDDPQECVHRKLQDKVCDWCAYGLFASQKKVIVLSGGIKAIPLFEPVPKE